MLTKAVETRVCRKKAKKVSKSKKTTFVELRALYGLPDTILGPSSLRYSQPVERGILWYWFSRFIRERDKHLPCINCGKFKDGIHAGHFIAAGKASWDEMVFSEKNVSGECSSCNLRDKTKLKYEYNLDQRYGIGTAQSLKDEFYGLHFKGIIHKNWNRLKLVENIEYYQRKVLELHQIP